MIKIITDSVADFSYEEVKALDITVIPLYVNFGDDAFQENIDITKDEFYKLLKFRTEFPKTSMPSIYDFSKYFKANMNKSEITIAILMSSGMSGTFSSAKIAQSTLGYSNCYIIDSKSCSCGEKILVEYAVKLRAENKSASEIVKAVTELSEKINVTACLDSLECLHRGGRVSGLASAVGAISNIKPIICITDGKVKICGKSFGIQRGMQFLANTLIKYNADRRFPIYILWSDDITNALRLKNILNEKGFIVKQNQLIRTGAVVGSHIGSNACGVAFVMQ